MKKFSYSGKNQEEIFRWQVAGFLAFIGMLPGILITFISIFLVPLSSYPKTSWNELRLTLLCWTIATFLISFLGGSFFINRFPSIWTDDDAIYISIMLIFRIKIPWSQLIEIKTISTHPKTHLIRAKRITPLHIHYGLYYSQSLKPGFLIRETIDDFNTLIGIIEEKISP